MISEVQRETIVRCARRFGASRVMLFGSCVCPQQDHRDIDIAVEGIPPQLFFRFCAEVMRQLGTPVDVVDLSEQNPFTQLVRERGVTIYG